MDHGAHAAALVEVGAGAEDEGPPAGVADARPNGCCSSGPATAAPWKPGHLGLVDGGERLADEVGGLAPAGAEHEGDVVPVGAGALGDDGGGLLRDGEGVGGRVGQEVVCRRHGEDSSEVVAAAVPGRWHWLEEAGWLDGWRDHARHVRRHHRGRPRWLRVRPRRRAAGRLGDGRRTRRGRRRSGAHRLRAEQGAHRHRRLHVRLRGRLAARGAAAGRRRGRGLRRRRAGAHRQRPHPRARDRAERRHPAQPRAGRGDGPAGDRPAGRARAPSRSSSPTARGRSWLPTSCSSPPVQRLG